MEHFSIFHNIFKSKRMILPELRLYHTPLFQIHSISKASKGIIIELRVNLMIFKVMGGVGEGSNNTYPF